MACIICQHKDRRAIEDYISTVDVPGVDVSLVSVATKFNVPLVDLQVHALMHTPTSRLEEDGLAPSLAAQIKRGEANLLYAVAEEYYQTLKQTGREVRARLAPKIEGAIVVPLSKEMVDLYIGVGNNLRQTVTALVDMNQKLSDEADPALKALQGIITAVRGKPTDDDD